MPRVAAVPDGTIAACIILIQLRHAAGVGPVQKCVGYRGELDAIVRIRDARHGFAQQRPETGELAKMRLATLSQMVAIRTSDS